MEQNYLTRAAKYLADLRKRKAWKKVVSALGTAVVFCTVYALILPAITLTRPLTCTVEVHHHNESCYAAVEPSTIAAGVNLPRQICGVESIYADVALGVDRADFVLHTHNESCWQDGQLVCTLPERHVHQHTAACYQTVKELTCGHPEVGTDTVPTNPDTQQPPVTVEPEPVPIHKHTEQCYTNALVCELEETPATAGHTHDESCYTTETIPSELICPITAETDPEHIHDANCYGPEQTNQVLACGQEESLPTEGHTHTDACWQMELTCGMQEGQPELTSIPDEPVPTSENDFDTITIADEVPVTVSQDGVETNMDGQQAPAGVHVHTDACYVEREILNCPDVIDTPHEHDDTCRDVNGNFICGRAVTREHIHTAECFVIDAPDENLPEPERTPICGKVEHEHGNDCYAPIEEPTVDRTEQDQKWGALFWSNIVGESSETISGQISANWMDTQNMDILALEALRNAEPQDMARYMDVNLTGIWIGDQNTPQGGHLYNVTNDGPMAPDAPFTVQLNWNLDASHFATETTTTTVPAETTTVPQEQQRSFTQQDMEGYSGDMAIAPIAYVAEQVVPETAATVPAPVTTTDVKAIGTLSYYYRLPDGIVVENVEKRVLYNEGTDNPALSYSVMDNVLNVTYYAPAESVNTTFTLKANWAEGVTENETFTLNWSNSTFSTVQFASPKLELTKSMGENGLRVEEDGTVWADYTVTVKNDSPVTAKDITLSDTLEAELFHFYRGGFAEGSADYTVTSLTPAATGEDGSEMMGETTTTTNETFPAEFDGGNTLVFPTFELAPGETKTFAYMAQMSAEDRETTDAAILAEAETLPQGQRPSGVTVSNTATLSCPGSKTPELTAKAQATYGGPDSKHIEDVSAEYKGEMFNATFTINGDAILPPGITSERVEELGAGQFMLSVKPFDEESEEYKTFVQHLENGTNDTEEAENEEGTEESTEKSTEEQLELDVLGLELRYNSMRLDLSNCDVTAVVTPNSAFENYHKPVVASEKEEEGLVLGVDGYSMTLKAFTMSEETVTDAITGETTSAEPVEEGAVSIDIVTKESNDIMTADEPVMLSAEAETFAANSATSTREIRFTARANAPMALEASDKAFPSYQVNFCAKLDRLAFSTSKPSTNGLPVIDTSTSVGGRDKAVLPKNSKIYGELDRDTQILRYLSVDAAGKIVTQKEMHMLFGNVTVKFNPSVTVDLSMFNILEQLAQKDLANPDGESNYELQGFAINYDTENKLSELIDASGKWNFSSDKRAYAVNKDSASKYTIKEGSAVTIDGNQITLPRDDVITLIFEPNESKNNRDLETVFYDYDMTDGKVYTKVVKDANGKDTDKVDFKSAVTRTAETGVDKNLPASGVTWFTNSKDQGINSPSNYPKDVKGVKYAFGNKNGGSGLASQEINGNTLNKANFQNSSDVKRATFGIVQESLDPNGKLRFSPGIIGPDLFDQGKAEGKTSYTDYSLGFKRVGDTYTMAQVNGTASGYAANLDLLSKNYKDQGTIRTNDFWPLDNAPSHGTETHDLKYGNTGNSTQRYHFDGTSALNDGKAWGSYPPADFAYADGNAANHNCLFGMQFSVEFTIPDGYVGPLDYCFFGDDDLWLYLESRDGTLPNGKKTQLVCDIGGVHSSLGEYVDLWDYISEPGVYELHLYYTERGHSGSTCWMQYTLPGLRSLPVVPDPDDGTGTLRIAKEVTDSSHKNELFSFNLILTGGEEGKKYTYTIQQEDGSFLIDTIAVGTTMQFNLKGGQSIAMNGLAPNMEYLVEEIDPNNAYQTTITTNKSSLKEPLEEKNTKTTKGKIEGNTAIIVTYTNSYSYTLPETGGLGTSNRIWYTYGALPVMAAAVVVYKRSRKKGGNVS